MCRVRARRGTSISYASTHPRSVRAAAVTAAREQQVVETFVALTDTLVSDFDALDLMTTLAERSSELLDVTAAGVALTDHQGGLSVATASLECSWLLEVFAVAIDAGPCVDCARTGEAVTCEDIDAEPERWARFPVGAGEAEFRAVHALPMRLRDEMIGVLMLLHTAPHGLSPRDRRLGQALAEAATIGMLSARAVRHAETTAAQLQGALTSRVVIEQAKGVLAGQGGLTPEDAFTVLRTYARTHQLRLTDVARDIVAGAVDLTAIVRPALQPAPRGPAPRDGRTSRRA